VALDGRRRRLGLLMLRDRGDITDDYVVECLLAETPAQQTAAIVLPNTENAPIHIADVIAAIGKLRRSKMDTQAIAAALGYAELEIKRLEDLDTAAGDTPTALAPVVSAMAVVAGAPLTRSRIDAVLLTPSEGLGVTVTNYTVPLPSDQLPDAGEDEAEIADEAGHILDGMDGPPTRWRLQRQFCGGLEASAAQIVATRYRRVVTSPIPALDGEVFVRLDARRAAYKASGLRPIPWVETLPHGEKMALMAELTAASLNLRGAKTTSVRDAACAEASEIAALCGADIWTPDHGRAFQKAAHGASGRDMR